MEIARTIREQLGGRIFALMTGAKGFVALSGGGLSFRVGRNSKGVNRVVILYDKGGDCYNLEFGRMRASTYKVLSEACGVYCDQLQSIFTAHTGLETRL